MEKILRFAALFFILFGSFASTGQAEVESAMYPLRRNPFDFSAIKPPEKIIEQDVDIEEQKILFDLRATLVSRDNSIANLNGKILMVGDKIEGYRLLKIGEDEVLLEKNGEQVTVSF